MQAITADLVRSALAHVPSNLPRDEWVRVGMALKSEFPGDDGLLMFNVWSSTGDAYSESDVRSTWRSIKAGGAVKIGTLLRLAKSHGFNVGEGAAVDPQVQAQRAREREQMQRTESTARAVAQADAAQGAVAMWESASEDGRSSYLERKGVRAFGVRFAVRGDVPPDERAASAWLLVPLRDEAGALWNVQQIAPAPSRYRAGNSPGATGTDKLFCRGGRKSGLWHMLGNAAGAAVVLAAEGYATAASLHEATGYPVAVAFDAGNLVHVAKSLRKLYPDAVLLMCGDDDVQTSARMGRNPGREKATAAAAAVGGLAVFPPVASGAGENVDFNDHHLSAGLEAVRMVVAGALQAESGAMPLAPKKNRQRPTVAADDARTREPFTVSDSGVWFSGVDREGRETAPEWICSRLDVEALTRDQDGAGWGYLLQFADPLGTPKQWAMPARMLAGDGGEYRAALLNMGLRIAPSPRARNKLTEYIQTRQPEAYAQCTERIGWHGSSFVLPHETIGDDGERIVFQSDSQMENTFRVRTDADLWRDRVGMLCIGNSRLVFAVSCAFAGPLLHPAGMESGGFHLRGGSSSGKTTALKVAASVYGGQNYLQRWRTTDNALEAIAAQHCDALLILDELAQVDPKTAGECAYMLANEQSKARSTRSGAPRARLSWRLLFLSAGELGLADHMAEGMKRVRTGQEVRMADIPADAGAGLGMFEELHGHEGGSAFSTHLVRQARNCYGAVGRAFLVWACSQADTLARRVREKAASLALQIVPESASGQVHRVGNRFALVGAAGELATEAGLTGWQPGEAARAARACFEAWLKARGGTGDGEVTAMLRKVRGFLEAHGDGRFTWWHRAADDHAGKTLQRAGMKRLLTADGKPIKAHHDHQREYGETMTPLDGETVKCEYFVLPDVFRSEVCSGYDHQEVARVLQRHGVLDHDAGRLTYSARLPGMGSTKCFRINSGIFNLDI